ncbi:hypothetical protein M431DRAFT_499039 [Trichoderma harzianum CBS 226.95]|uniref:Uncharacterized protein n=1 Tax=Trichoderma harzianum CBS 226.95 TaxID=983964 RepID=A0A2T4A1H2_TRIHA|nr:hypothetical protein M431DRAFT_499039 [Trichoderma harzianum CBS 226.95]PTB50917.1 hypothetical protein M431DRAFT_499039 [Trichoderma harzianum CBS 226.95]
MADAVPSDALDYEACRLSSITLQTDGETPVATKGICNLKRKTEEGEVKDDTDTQISKKHRALHHHDVSSPGLSPCLLALIRPPEPSSINGILRQHCRKSLYVKPLYWKLQHLELLGCQFHAKIEKEQNARFQGQSQGETRRDQVPRNTTKLPPDIIIRRAVKEFPGKSQFSSDLNFYFNGRHVTNLYTYGIFSRTSYEADGPSLAFLSLRDVSQQRDMSIRFPWHVERSSPEYRIAEKKRKNVRPVNEVEDPYIAAVLIALAQKQQRRQHAVAGTQADTPNREDDSFLVPRSIRLSVGKYPKSSIPHQVSSNFVLIP